MADIKICKVQLAKNIKSIGGIVTTSGTNYDLFVTEELNLARPQCLHAHQNQKIVVLPAFVDAVLQRVHQHDLQFHAGALLHQFQPPIVDFDDGNVVEAEPEHLLDVNDEDAFIGAEGDEGMEIDEQVGPNGMEIENANPPVVPGIFEAPVPEQDNFMDFDAFD
uniref:BRCT domain-containing protein n=1 Tax=Panagrolaimus sp. JU765 TaxID=591449 RepID=A0AC34R711_9BILA